MSSDMEATIIIRRIDGSELFRDNRDYQNFREVLAFLPGDFSEDIFLDGCIATADRFETLPFKATVHLRITAGTPQQCGEHICRFYDYYLRLRYNLEGSQTRYSVVEHS